MSTFWFNVVYLMMVWFIALYYRQATFVQEPVVYFLSTLFFSLYFILPLVRKNLFLHNAALYLLILLTVLTFYASPFYGFVFLIFIILAKEAADHFNSRQLTGIIVVQYVAAILPDLLQERYETVFYSTLLAIAVGFLFRLWVQTNRKAEQQRSVYEELHLNYRQIKRDLVSNETLVRQQERAQIAREIHDSVGHRLTALLMQLEVSRLQAADPELKGKFQSLKELAQTSLDETREAVKTLASEHTTGLPAIMQLIRKLESESHVRVTFVVQAGALSAQLSNQQSIVIYRAVQEALTNMMRHSSARQAQIEFTLVGERYFRFTVSNPHERTKPIEEGFGLKSMRERIEQIGGSLVLTEGVHQFKLTGTFPLEKGETTYGINTIS